MSVGCRTCGTLNPPGTTTCQHCGAGLIPSTPLYHDPFRTRPMSPAAPMPPQRAVLLSPATGVAHVAKDPFHRTADRTPPRPLRVPQALATSGLARLRSA